jgi:hypothetical protein
MATTSDRMQIPEYVKRELSEVYLLMDHIAGRKDKTLDQALAPPTTGGLPVTLEDLCEVAWPPTDQNRAKTLALVLTAKDRLSRAAYPATGYSVAFTYLSLAQYINAARGSLRQRLLAPFGRRIALDASRLSAAAPAKPSDAGATDGGSGEDAAGVALPNSSAMVQFAKDAFPGLEFARESPFDKVPRLFLVLLILLAVTCFVSWDLAVGQRLLADYRWLSSHPQVLQFDATTEPCSPKNVPDPSKIEPGGQCARYLAGARVLPLANNWIGRQFGLRWFILAGSAALSPSVSSPSADSRSVSCPSVNSPSDDSLHSSRTPSIEASSCQGYIFELTRVLVTTLNYNVLPLFLGSLAATAAALRSIATKIAGHELEPRDLAQIWPRVLLGAFLGAMIGLFTGPGPSNGFFALVAGAETAGTSSVALPPAAFAFLAGFATGRIFQWLDNLVERIFAFANPKP